MLDEEWFQNRRACVAKDAKWRTSFELVLHDARSQVHQLDQAAAIAQRL